MKHKKRFDNQSGYAMVITLLALLLITGIGASLMVMGMNTARITKSERDNQSSYYIAEAGLVEKRAQINEIAKQVYLELKNEYDMIQEPAVKKNFKLEDRFKSNVQKQIQNSIVLIDKKTYTQQYAESPESVVNVTQDSDNPMLYLITSIGKIPSESGGFKEKTVSQNVEVKMNVPISKDSIEKPGENTIRKFQACFAVNAEENIVYAGGNVKGSIYSKGNIDITNGSVSGSVIAEGYIKSNRDIQGNLVANQGIEITGGTILGSAYGRGITISNGTIRNNLVSQLNATITGGSILGSAYGQGILLAGGTVSNNLVSQLDTVVTGGSVGKDIVSKRDITIQRYPTLSGNAIAKNNININEDWFTGITGKYIYGSSIYFKNPNNNHNNNPSKAEKRSDIDALIANYPIPQTILNSNDGNGSECINNLPSLPLVAQSFPTQNASLSNISLNPVSDRYTLKLSEDAYFNTIKLVSGHELNIDLMNGNKTIYVDNLDIVQGFINIENPGKLKIVVRNRLTMTGSSRLNYDDKLSKSENSDNVGNVTIYYAGNDSITLAGDIRLNSHLHIKNADLNVSGSGLSNGDIVGYGKSVIDISGGSSTADQLILAPFSTLNMAGSGNVSGNIIVSKFNITGGATVNPPSTDYGEWEVPGIPSEIIEIPIYGEGTDFLSTGSLIQE